MTCAVPYLGVNSRDRRQLADAFEAAHGQVGIESRVGRGTAMRILLPPTLMGLDAVLLRAGGAVFAVPWDQLDAELEVGPHLASALPDGTEVLRWGGAQVPLLRLRTRFGLEAGPPAGADPVLLPLRAAGRRLALAAEEHLGTRRVVVRGSTDERARGVAGRALLEDGTEARLLDVELLLP